MPFSGIGWSRWKVRPRGLRQMRQMWTVPRCWEVMVVLGAAGGAGDAGVFIRLFLGAGVGLASA